MVWSSRILELVLGVYDLKEGPTSDEIFERRRFVRSKKRSWWCSLFDDCRNLRSIVVRTVDERNKGHGRKRNFANTKGRSVLTLWYVDLLYLRWSLQSFRRRSSRFGLMPNSCHGRPRGAIFNPVSCDVPLGTQQKGVMSGTRT